jgi:hypothetical protein
VPYDQVIQGSTRLDVARRLWPLAPSWATCHHAEQEECHPAEPHEMRMAERDRGRGTSVRYDRSSLRTLPHGTKNRFAGRALLILKFRRVAEGEKNRLPVAGTGCERSRNSPGLPIGRRLLTGLFSLQQGWSDVGPLHGTPRTPPMAARWR